MGTRRLLTVVELGKHDSVRIYRDREFDCYTVVTVYVDKSGYKQRAECEESDLTAARGTAAAECRWVRRYVRGGGR